eukprot:TRINITY_DN8533_c0_g1_i1.p1 TRINITY_DN8533_c0_g1~~TRINITY_DN8533_c0_g1_i1.p1  ORF type:complete len:133 (+),score=25.68 TRINITY_DN8533_c0_g1_i1:60-401(+)
MCIRDRNESEIKDNELFIIQMRGIIYMNNAMKPREPVVQKLDYYVRGIQEYTILVEIPAAIKINSGYERKFQKIRSIFEIVARLGKVNQRKSNQPHLSKDLPNQKLILEEEVA